MKKVFSVLLFSFLVLGILYFLIVIIYVGNCNDRYMPVDYTGDPDLLNIDVLILLMNSFLLWLSSCTIFFNCINKVRNSLYLSSLSFFIIPLLSCLLFTLPNSIYPVIVSVGIIIIFFLLQTLNFFIFWKIKKYFKTN